MNRWLGTPVGTTLRQALWLRHRLVVIGMSTLSFIFVAVPGRAQAQGWTVAAEEEPANTSILLVALTLVIFCGVVYYNYRNGERRAEEDTAAPEIEQPNRSPARGCVEVQAAPRLASGVAVAATGLAATSPSAGAARPPRVGTAKAAGRAAARSRPKTGAAVLRPATPAAPGANARAQSRPATTPGLATRPEAPRLQATAATGNGISSPPASATRRSAAEEAPARPAGFCTQCGAGRDAEDHFCRACGRPLRRLSQPDDS